MAYNFLRNTPPYRRLQQREQEKYDAILNEMTDDYVLRSGAIQLLATRLHCGEATIQMLGRIIRRVVALYNGNERVREETEERAARGTQESLKALTLWDPGIAWHTVFGEEEQMPSAPVTAMVPADSYRALQEENRVLRNALEESEERYNALILQLSRISSDRGLEPAEEGEPALPEKSSDRAVLANLPILAKVGNETVPIEYRPAFWKAYAALDKLKQKDARKAIRNLAEHGYKATKQSQDHKKHPVGLTNVPKDTVVSRVCRKYRYLWDLVQSDGGRTLVVYTIATHDKVWMSEG